MNSARSRPRDGRHPPKIGSHKTTAPLADMKKDSTLLRASSHRMVDKARQRIGKVERTRPKQYTVGPIP